MGDRTKDAERCTHCHLCQDGCAFLSKYGIDIGNIDELKRLAYHCFLCGECTRACPEEIDGRETVFELRQERMVDADVRAVVEKKYKGLLAEKAEYRFRNYRRATSGLVYFPGCNFPSLFPKTSEYISKLLKENHGIGTVYDCCGKPVAELGLTEDEERILEDMSRRLKEQGITEIVTACPNCWEFLSGRIKVPVVDIYTKLHELGYSRKLEGDYKLFVPCPDRGNLELLEAVKLFIGGKVEVVSGINCCGLGGGAAANEPELARSFTECLKTEDRIYTYCASCTGNFTRNGVPVGHILTEILDTNEKPDTRKSYINRVLTKYKR